MTGPLAVTLPFGEDLFYPLLITETIEIGIRLINHFVLWLLTLVRLVTILCTSGDMTKTVLHVIGIDELLFQFLPLFRIRT